jgi:hypothetical protein
MHVSLQLNFGIRTRNFSNHQVKIEIEATLFRSVTSSLGTRNLASVRHHPYARRTLCLMRDKIRCGENKFEGVG